MNEKNLVPDPEILEPDDCWRLLTETNVGRLSVIANGHPDIFPVSFVVDGRSVVFRTGMGTKQQAIEADSVVALEADAVSDEFGLAWSVVIKGQATQAGPSSPGLTEARRGMFPWQGVGKELLYVIVPDSITGRRFDLSATNSFDTPLNEATRAGLE